MTTHGVVSADSHVTEPADLWQERLDRRYRDRSPKIVPNPPRLWGDDDARPVRLDAASLRPV